MVRFFLVFVFISASVWAQYPSRPIRLFVPNPPGGATDTLARVFAPKLGEALGQPVVVENRPGSNGNLAMEVTARAAPASMPALPCERSTAASSRPGPVPGRFRWTAAQPLPTLEP